MFGLGAGELIAIGVIGLLFFGGKKIPQLGGSLAKGIRNFQKGLKSEDDSPQIEDKENSSSTPDKE